mmetsp:Transcript_15977/g.40683  ORF Transcript_15977/g.40683 Transcript_15977/m.40683 type:complete len:213 (+) Transcript_15977:420-1058(+)
MWMCGHGKGLPLHDCKYPLFLVFRSSGGPKHANDDKFAVVVPRELGDLCKQCVCKPVNVVIRAVLQQALHDTATVFVHRATQHAALQDLVDEKLEGGWLELEDALLQDVICVWAPRGALDVTPQLLHQRLPLLLGSCLLQCPLNLAATMRVLSKSPDTTRHPQWSPLQRAHSQSLPGLAATAQPRRQPDLPRWGWRCCRRRCRLRTASALPK